ncbi:uncharacterized protein LOC129589522 [Paramacrobiotus metropolitanus]|uniref:uncharacterized protein LOC129589522 n=1 Tax=Paramacrobiotus metropolitanus TaxID=2943436 RepID=UPI002446442F|nr:uncharacterized protein LOC129589522 [Paramacrobiotus metropolitanus]
MPSGMNRDNAVDVLFDDGLMRYARVVDVADNGLFVDLLCPDRRRELVSFDRLFVLSKMSEADLSPTTFKEFPTDPVEVLVPETSLGPWIWISGQAVSFGPGMARGECRGALAEWRCPYSGEVCQDFVPSERIRWSVQAERNARRLAYCQRIAAMGKGISSSDQEAALQDHIGPETLVKQTLQLDDRFRSLSSEEAETFVRELNGCGLDLCRCTVFVMDFVDGNLVYICQSGHSQPVHSKNRRSLASLASLYLDWKLFDRSQLAPPVLATPDRITLSVELWLEFFSHWRTEEQMELRAVCKTWDTLIAEPVVSSRITLGGYDDAKWRFRHFFPPATLYKCLQPGTHYILMAHSGFPDNAARNAAVEDMLMLSRMIRYAAQQRTGIRLRQLHIHRFDVVLAVNSAVSRASSPECVLHNDDSATVKTIVNRDFPSLQDFIAACDSLPCKAVLLTSSEVSLVYAYFFLGRMEAVMVHVEIRKVRLLIGPDFGGALWNAMDATLPVPSKQTLQELLDRLNYRNTDAQRELKQVVCQMLCALQSADPRPSAHYHGKKWCVDGLQGLQVEKLSRTARHFLLALQTVTCSRSIG